ncbi:lysozyme inhibitor LprI family protein [Agrilutibacter terrestris]
MPVAVPQRTQAEGSDRQQASTTAAGNGGLRQSYYECAQAGDGSTWSMQECIAREAEYQEDRLNKVYQMLRSRLSTERKERLKLDERKWLAERSSNCSWDATNGGQGQRIEANICSLKMTAERVAELERLLASSDV